MKVSAVLLTLALAAFVSAAPQQQKQNAIQNNNNNKNGQAQNGKNGQNNNNNNNNGKGNNNGNNGKGGANNGNNGGKGGQGNNNNNDPQTSLTLDPKVISTGFENNGQDVPTAGQVASLTSSNNFINFCLTVPNLPLTNGKQVTTGSCNTAPMGIIPSTDNMPSSKFVSPKNGDVIKSNTPFTVTMAISNLETGNFVNAQENYFAAPQQLNGQGQIKGHSHVVIESITSFQQTTPTNPKVFAFFKGLNNAAANGQLTADVTNGLPAGTYKLSSINTAANHQPCLVPIAQHGSLDDAVYFSITDDGQAPANNVLAPPAAAAGGNNNQASQNNNQTAQAGGNANNNGNKGAAANNNTGAAATANNTGAAANNNNNNQAAQQNGQKAGQTGNDNKQASQNNNDKQAAQNNNNKQASQNNNKQASQNNNDKKGQQNNGKQNNQQQNNNQQKGQNGKGKRGSRLRL